jgi:hypothetical protein
MIYNFKQYQLNLIKFMENNKDKINNVEKSILMIETHKYRFLMELISQSHISNYLFDVYLVLSDNKKLERLYKQKHQIINVANYIIQLFDRLINKNFDYSYDFNLITFYNEEMINKFIDILNEYTILIKFLDKYKSREKIELRLAISKYEDNFRIEIFDVLRRNDYIKGREILSRFSINYILKTLLEENRFEKMIYEYYMYAHKYDIYIEQLKSDKEKLLSSFEKKKRSMLEPYTDIDYKLIIELIKYIEEAQNQSNIFIFLIESISNRIQENINLINKY